MLAGKDSGSGDGNSTLCELQELALMELKRNHLLGVVKVNLLPHYTKENHRAMSRVLEGESVWRNNSPASLRLLEQLRKIVPAKYLLLTNSGTAGLHTVLSYYQTYRPGVTYIQGYNWYAAGAMAIQAGCTPHFVDVGSVSLRADLMEVPSSAQCVLVSHLFGAPSLSETQLKEIRRKSIPMIEDCAQCVTGKVGAESVGLLGDVSIFSFNGSKQICAGEGGAIATNNSELADYCENFVLTVNSPLKPSIKRFNSASAGFNYRLPAVSASLAASLVEELGWRLQSATDAATRLASLLETFRWVTLPTWPLPIAASPLGLPILLKEQKGTMSLAESRALLFYFLQYSGVPVSVWVDQVLPDTHLYQLSATSRGWEPSDVFVLPNGRHFADAHLVFPTAPAMAQTSVLDTIQKVLALYEGLYC